MDPAHPFPYISGLSLNLAVLVRNPKSGKEHFARVKVPQTFHRFIAVDEQRFVPLEDVIAEHLKPLFPGMTVVAVHSFRVTRNEDLEVEEDDAENLLAALEKGLQRRRFGPPVRLEVEETIDDHVLELLVSELGMNPAEVVRVPGPLDLRGLHDIADLDRAELKYPAFIPSTHAHLSGVESASPVDVFTTVRGRDVLLHHPYDSFSTSVQRFIEQAALDPAVLAIKQTLYRTSGDSPIVEALIDAAEAGKQVLVVVEIKARFDEGANIKWARKLEEAGCHVVYGLVGLKTHCKLALVVRDEPDGMRRYVHIGTGNYNPKTARLYEDLGLMTINESITEDVAHLFNNLSGYARKPTYNELLVAPHSIRDGLVERIHREIEAFRAGEPARIRFKANAIVDEAVIDALYTASRAGVPWSCSSAASVRCAPASLGCRRPSRSGRCSAGSSSTAGSSGSRTTVRRRCGSGRPTSCTATSTGGWRSSSPSPTPTRWRRWAGCSMSPSTPARPRGASVPTGCGPATPPTRPVNPSWTCRSG